MLNAIAIAANGGTMPLSLSTAAGLSPGVEGNVSTEENRFSFLGDVFALPDAVPLDDAFSVGDLLIGLGAVLIVVTVSLGCDGEQALLPRRILEPFASRDFRRLAAGRLVSHVGDWLTIAALLGWISMTRRARPARLPW